MPNIKSAKKKMKQDIKRTEQNKKYEEKIDNIFRSAQEGVKSKKDEFITEAYSVIDKAAKKNVIHDNKAARLKKRVSRLVSSSS